MIRRSLLAALALLALVALIIHYKVHPYFVTDPLSGALTFDGSKFLASLLGFIDLLVVTGLYMRRQTAVYGFLLNGMIVIFGTVLMGHYAIAHFMAKGVPQGGILLNSNLIDIALAWVDFLVGQALYMEIMRAEK